MSPEVSISRADIGDETSEGYRTVFLLTDRGRIEARYYIAEGASGAAVFVGGIGGDFDTPAKGLYPRLCGELQSRGISALRVAFRHPTELDESVHDVLAGLSFLSGEGIEAAGLVGHSFGGAVVIQAAALSNLARTVVTLATQGAGADAVSSLPQATSILLTHGKADTALSPQCSAYAYGMAHEPRRLILYDDAGHGLDEVAEEVHGLIYRWLLEHLAKA